MKRFYLLFFSLLAFGAFAQSPRVLIVTAHPDDETMFPVTIFKITHELKGSADLALITDASGGYNGLVASSYYGMNLVDSVVGRKHLPLIRKKELMASGEILGSATSFSSTSSTIIITGMKNLICKAKTGISVM
jgi:LmbE family N-acetylglucosaminyl deacetylase